MTSNRHSAGPRHGLKQLFLPLFLGLSSLLAQEPPRSRPNVVVMVVDDLGRNDLGCYGSAYYKTPAMDRLARQGMLFTSAYSSAPICNPSRAALLTGRYPVRLGLTDGVPAAGAFHTHALLPARTREQLPLGEVTLAEALKPAGYTSACLGQWMLGGRGYGPRDQGFSVVTAAGAPPADRSGTEVAPAENGIGSLAVAAEKFLDQHGAKPFFLYLSHQAMQAPLGAAPERVARYQKASGGGSQTNAVYGAMLEEVDESVGRVLKRLEELGLSEKTIVILTADAGGVAGVTSNSPFRQGQGALYEGGLRVPLLVRWPGNIAAGTTNATPVIGMDLYPTLLELCGITSARAVDGVSLAAELRQSGKIQREAIFWHYPHYNERGGIPGGAVRMGDYKLVQFFETKGRELYNVKEDPNESWNLAEVEPEKTARLLARLESWRREAGAVMPRSNPAHEKGKAAREKGITQGEDGSILLHSRDVQIHGTTVRYEAQPHKNTVGYWVRAQDWISWDFQLREPGRYEVEILQGCGNGSGGSEVSFVIDGQALEITVQETGGFQQFVARTIGQVNLGGAGRHTLQVRPRTKPRAAVMDLRQVVLRPVR